MPERLCNQPVIRIRTSLAGLSTRGYFSSNPVIDGLLPQQFHPQRSAPSTLPPPIMSNQQQPVAINSLPLPTLSRLQQQLTSELEHLSTSYQRLRAAQSRFRDCISAIKATQATTSTTAQLIPLTTSLYVPATPSSSKSVLVDVGTGFYIEKTPEQGVVFYEGKVRELESNLGTIEGEVRGKTDTLRAVEDGMRKKVVEQGGVGGQGQGVSAG